MTTYDNYYEAKIANPKGDIFESVCNGFFTTKDWIDKNNNGRFLFAKCNPADHCMTVEKFLADGYKFVEGDLIVGVGGLVTTVCDTSIEAWNDGESDDSDSKRYILSAAALKPRDNDYAMSIMERKVKVDYVQEKSFKEVLKCAIDGEVFYSKDGKGEFKFDASRLLFVNHSGADLDISHLTEHEFYRHIETEMTERDEFIASYIAIAKVGVPIALEDWAGKVFDELVEGE